MPGSKAGRAGTRPLVVALWRASSVRPVVALDKLVPVPGPSAGCKPFRYPYHPMILTFVCPRESRSQAIARALFVAEHERK
jgi:hypothetical protein